MRFQQIVKLQTRFQSTVVPPKVSSIREIGKLVSKYPQAHPELFARMKYFYKVLPKGNAMKETPNGMIARYKAKYFENNSLMPVLHFFGVMVPVGYYIAYFKGGHYHPLKEFH